MKIVLMLASIAAAGRRPGYTPRGGLLCRTAGARPIDLRLVISHTAVSALVSARLIDAAARCRSRWRRLGSSRRRSGSTSPTTMPSATSSAAGEANGRVYDGSLWRAASGTGCAAAKAERIRAYPRARGVKQAMVKSDPTQAIAEQGRARRSQGHARDWRSTPSARRGGGSRRFAEIGDQPPLVAVSLAVDRGGDWRARRAAAAHRAEDARRAFAVDDGQAGGEGQHRPHAPRRARAKMATGSSRGPAATGGCARCRRGIAPGSSRSPGAIAADYPRAWSRPRPRRSRSARRNCRAATIICPTSSSARGSGWSCRAGALAHPAARSELTHAEPSISFS